MTGDWIILGVLLVGCAGHALSVSTEDNPAEYMSREEREALKETARDMFYHGYNAYMDNAYPADELMPLSCKGRYRGSEPDRGDIDSTLGNFSLTLVDTLDTLVVLGDLEEFENAVRLVVETLTFDTDVIVSLFETNIRMLGGLLSGHILAEYLQLRAAIMPWYRGELLALAKDLGFRFLPAFNTTTGIPFGRINLRYGMKGVPAEMCRETCTACGGSMILEMAALSRLTGESIFEEKAQRAMDALWKMRHRGTDLMGSVLNVHSGDWVRRDSGVGAGIDSYYEYCLKAYILLGDEKYLGRFNKHYDAIMKYVSQGPMLLDVHMHRPNTNSKNFMDALLAFWPGLQVLKGDIKPAVETHEMLYQVMQRHNFIPEAFTTDFQVHWGHHPLRPEFLESTYFLYRATGDHYYLGVGRKVLESLQTYARVTCGYAAVSDVRTNKHDDTMDSFVLSETFKYLFLLFAEPNDLVLDLDEFIFTTEGHLLPLTLAAVRTNVTADVDRDVVEVDELDRTCPNSLHLFPASVRQPLRNMVEDVCPRRTPKRRLRAAQFQANNLEHLKLLSNMGITILTMSDGRVQLLHTFANARTAPDAEEGLVFMQEIVELSKLRSENAETRPQFVRYTTNDPPEEVTLLGGPANFGPGFKDGKTISGVLELVMPSEACSDLMEPEKLVGKIAMVTRGNCMFIEKARRIQKAGAIAGIVLDTVVGSSAFTSPMFAMSGDGKTPDDVTIPVVFLFTKEAAELVFHMATAGALTVTLGDFPRSEAQLKAPSDQSVYERLKTTLKDFLVRPDTSQNSKITRDTSDVKDAANIEKDVNEEIVIAEYGNLRTRKRDDRDYVTIEKTGISSIPKSVYLQNLNDFEKTWYSIKQDSVNAIYANDDPVLLVSMERIKFLYTVVHTLRGMKPMAMEKDTKPWHAIGWLTRELSEIRPDAIEESQSSNSPDNNRNDATHNTMNIDGSDDASTSSVGGADYESVANDMAEFVKKVMRENPGNTIDALRKHFRASLLHFKWQLYGDIGITKDRDEYLVSSRRTNDDDDDEESKIFERCNVKAVLSKKRGIVEFSIINGNPGTTVETLNDVENDERIWYAAKQFLISAICSMAGRPLTIDAEALSTMWSQINTLRRNGKLFSDSLENVIINFLDELCRVEPDVMEMGHLIFVRVNRQIDDEDSSNYTMLVAKRAEEHARIYEKFPEIFARTKNNANVAKDAVTNNEEKMVTNDVTSDGIAKDLRNDDDVIDDASNEGKKMIVDEILSSKKKMSAAATTNDSKKSEKNGVTIENIVVGKTSGDDKMADGVTESTSNVETGRLIGVKKFESATGDDPLEEFKKPIWASEDDDDVPKSFARLREKTVTTRASEDAGNSNDYEYRSDYATDNRETRERRIVGRNDDEL